MTALLSALAGLLALAIVALTAVAVLLIRSRRQYADQERRLHHALGRDRLTGLWTYPHWLERLALVAADRDERQLGVVFVGCDGFRGVNARYGHLDADRILGTLGARLRDLATTSDWHFCRFGGDEFAGWIVQDADPAAFEQSCQEVAELLAAPIALDGHEAVVTVGVGRTLSRRPGDRAEELAEAAEVDLRRRKLRRPGAVLTQHAERDVVHRMIESGDISVAYQPIVRLADQSLWGCEALLRGRTGVLGAIPPPVLVESASAAHLLDAVTREVMEQALAVADRARRVAGSPVTLTLNIETEQLHPASALLSWLVERVDALGVPVVLELAEREPLEWTAETDLLAHELAGHGIGLGLDDVGAGHSRALVLGARPWELVKLDRGLLLEDHLGRGPIVLRHVKRMLDDYGLAATVLEGIETDEHLALALELGFAYGQGNGLGAATTADSFLSEVRSWPMLPS